MTCTADMQQGLFWERLTSTKLQNFKMVQLKSFADDSLKVTQMAKFVLHMVENIVGKGENAGNQHFLLSPQCFQQVPFSGLLKVGILW